MPVLLDPHEDTCWAGEGWVGGPRSGGDETLGSVVVRTPVWEASKEDPDIAILTTSPRTLP